MGTSVGQCDGVRDEDPTHRIHRVFISYSRSEFYFAEQLAASMRRRGVVVWFDVHELVAGTDWSAAIDRAIAECDTFVFIASRSALASPYVQRERELAAELDRPCVAVLPHRLPRSRLPGIATYDLTSSFRRGVDQLASDLISGQQRGRRRRLPLPFSAAACVVALAPVWCTIFAVVLGAAFATTVVGRETDLLSEPSDADRAVAISASTIILLGAWSTYVCWSFSMRRVTWLSLRGSQFLIPVTTLLALGFVELLAEYVTTDPLGRALGSASEDLVLGDAPAMAVDGRRAHKRTRLPLPRRTPPVCAAISRPASPRIACAGVTSAPSRVVPDPRRPHLSIDRRDDDLRVADGSGARCPSRGCPADDGEPIVRSSWSASTPPTGCRWTPSESVAVVATSVALPIRGVLQQFQWVDYRRRRRRTLAALGRDLHHERLAVMNRSHFRTFPNGCNRFGSRLG